MSLKASFNLSLKVKEKRHISVLIYSFWGKRKRKNVSCYYQACSLSRGRSNPLNLKHEQLPRPRVRTVVGHHDLTAQPPRLFLLLVHEWILPLPSSYKINVDASFRSTYNVSCSRIIVRDFEGFIIGAGYRINLDINSIFKTEVLALLQGLDFARDLELQFVNAEGDNKSTISKLNSPSSDLSAINPLVQDVKLTGSRFFRLVLG
ncbi:hypothetical protein GQ457_02G002090 [Hibiscus cannabinus]